MSVFFVGAGPGDVELITVKGQRLLAEADVVVYAGSLVNPGLLSLCQPAACIYNSASMTLNEVIEVMVKAHRQNQKVVRLHTGDPSIYGAIQEQMECLDKEGIAYEVIPGVSSFLAAAAALKQEFTLPGISQTVVITRIEGRTPVPEKQKLASLAAHQGTMCIFLSVQMIDKVTEELIAGGYAPTTPAAVVEKASWPDERVLRGTLATIGAIVTQAGISRTAMIIVGEVLAKKDYDLSCLYAPDFAHMFRDAK